MVNYEGLVHDELCQMLFIMVYLCGIHKLQYAWPVFLRYNVHYTMYMLRANPE